MMNLFSNPKTFTSIYIGIEKIAVAQVSRSIKGLQLEKVAESDLPPSSKGQSEQDYSISPSSGYKKDNEISGYAEVLKDLLKKHDFQTENVISVIPNRDIMVRYFTLPRVAKSEVSSAVKFEAKKYIPFSLDEIVSDYHIISYGSSKNEMEILFAAVKKELIQKHLSIFKECNFSPSNIRIPSLTLLGMIYNYQSIIGFKKSASYVMIEVNEGLTSITIFKDGIPYLIRDFSLKESKSPQVSITDTDYENFLHELHLSLEYYYGQFPSTSINEIFLFDDGTLKDKISSLNSEFNISITQPSLNRVIKGRIDEHVSSQSTIAICTAAAEHLKSKVDINLAPSEEKVPVPSIKISKGISTILRPLLTEVAVLLIAALVLYIALGKRIMATLEGQIKSVIGDRARINKAFVNLSKRALEEKLNKINQKKNILLSLINNRVYFTNKLSRLAIDLPKNTWIESLSYNSTSDNIKGEEIQMHIDGTLFIESEVEEVNIINSFLRDLKSDTAFMQGLSNVELSSVRRSKVRGFPVTYFKIKCY